MGRSPCCDKMGLKKGPWTPEEDEKLLAFIQQHGHGSWRALPSKAGLQRCGKSCRLRWANYLRPDIKRGKFSLQEEETIIQLHALLGNRWSAIASHLSKRTDNEIKNYWNTHLKKKLTKMGIDPITHKPKNLSTLSGGGREIANISHMAQWESARLEAEARLVRGRAPNPFHALPTTAPPPTTTAMPRPPCLDILKVWAWINPGKDISAMILNGGFPHSTVDWSPPSLQIPTFNGNSSNHVAFNHQDRDIDVKGIMGNSVELAQDHFTYTNTNTTNNINNNNIADHALAFPSFVMDPGFMDGNSDNVLGGCWGVVEEENNVNCWSSLLNFPTSPI